MRGLLVAIVLLASSTTLGCARRPSHPVPTDAEIARLGRTELDERFQALEVRLRRAGFEAGALDERADAGHAALVAFRRTHDASLARRARRWLGEAAIDAAPEGPACRASLDLVELERALGDTEAATARAEQLLASSTGDVRCRERVRRVASELGGSPGTSATGGGGRGSIRSIDVLGAEVADAAGVRVVVTLDADVRGELLPIAVGPDGPVGRLRFADVSVPASIGRRVVGKGGLERIEPSRAGIDLILDPGASVRASVIGNPTRWILDVDRAAIPSASPAASRAPVIVIDPGHGGDEHGARVDGVRESHLVLDIAKRAAAALAVLSPTSRIVLTRTTDDEVSLEQRAALANSVDADLFVSVHLNDADVPVITGGITTFVLDTDDERQARRLAARENATTTDRVSDLSVLLAGLHRDSQVAESRRLASFVHTATLSRARTTFPRLPDRGVRPATYYVLVGTRMPSVLVECSFMTRPEELTALRTAAYRQSLAEGIAAGIARYLESR